MNVDVSIKVTSNGDVESNEGASNKSPPSMSSEENLRLANKPPSGRENSLGKKKSKSSTTSAHKLNNDESTTSIKQKSRKSSKGSVKDKSRKSSSRKSSAKAQLNDCCEETNAGLLAENSYLHAMLQSLKVTIDEKSKEIHFLRSKVKEMSEENENLKDDFENTLQRRRSSYREDTISYSARQKSHEITDFHNSRRGSDSSESGLEKSFTELLDDSYSDTPSQNYLSRMKRRESTETSKLALQRYAASNAMGIWPTEDMKKKRQRYQPSNLIRSESEKVILPAINKVQPMIRKSESENECKSNTERDPLKLPHL